MRVFFLTLLCLAAHPLFASGDEPPLFAGNMIAYSANNTPPGHAFVQSYVYATHLLGMYNPDSRRIFDRHVHQYELEVEVAVGLTEQIDVTLEMRGFNIRTSGSDTFQPGDTNLFFGFHVLEEKQRSLVPSVRFLVGEFFPTGKYDNLDVMFEGNDGVGMGAFSTYLGFIASKTYHLGCHPFKWTVNVFYYLSSRVNVNGGNIFILDRPNLKGQVTPGVQFEFDLAFEYKFNRPWGVGLDIYFQQQNAGSFRSNHVADEKAYPTIPSSHLFSLLPTIEYNFSDRLSVLGGSWITVAGRNAPLFASYVFSFYYFF